MKPKYKLKSIGAAFDALAVGLKVCYIYDEEVEVCKHGKVADTYPKGHLYILRPPELSYDFADHSNDGYDFSSFDDLYIHPDSEAEYDEMQGEFVLLFERSLKKWSKQTIYEAADSIRSLSPPPATEEAIQ